MKEASEILRTRLHMSRLVCNYSQKQSDKYICPLCEHKGKITTEHYFQECTGTRCLAEIWNTNPEDLKGTYQELQRAKNHIKKVEVLMEPYMKKDVEKCEENVDD